VVIVDEPAGWRAFFCTEPGGLGSRKILTTVADRFSLEIAFRDCKEIVGAGSTSRCGSCGRSIGAFHTCPVDVHDDRGVGVEPRGGGASVGGTAPTFPLGLTLASPEPRRQETGVGVVPILGEEISCGSTPQSSARRKFRPRRKGC